MWLHRAGMVAVLSALALGSATGRTDDAPKSSAPGAGLLEFLGSVDRLSEVNPNYLTQPDPPKTAKTTPGAKPAPPPAAQAPGQAPPPDPSGPGAKNND